MAILYLPVNITLQEKTNLSATFNQNLKTDYVVKGFNVSGSGWDIQYQYCEDYTSPIVNDYKLINPDKLENNLISAFETGSYEPVLVGTSGNIVGSGPLPNSSGNTISFGKRLLEIISFMLFGSSGSSNTESILNPDYYEHFNTALAEGITISLKNSDVISSLYEQLYILEPKRFNDANLSSDVKTLPLQNGDTIHVLVTIHNFLGIIQVCNINPKYSIFDITTIPPVLGLEKVEVDSVILQNCLNPDTIPTVDLINVITNPPNNYFNNSYRTIDFQFTISDICP